MAADFMKTIIFTLFRITILTLLLSFNVQLHAQPDDISKQQAVATAQQVYPGRVLSVKRKGDVYHVKTLSESGEVRIILIDASSGKVISEP